MPFALTSRSEFDGKQKLSLLTMRPEPFPMNDGGWGSTRKKAVSEKEAKWFLVGRHQRHGPGTSVISRPAEARIWGGAHQIYEVESECSYLSVGCKVSDMSPISGQTHHHYPPSTIHHPPSTRSRDPRD
ncbi:hypothetical protein TWF751_002774 [Orbilia oligospora]|nr:hypothetical protein TWF751_002774 [Orbilia oligospora]